MRAAVPIAAPCVTAVSPAPGFSAANSSGGGDYAVDLTIDRDGAAPSATTRLQPNGPP